MSIKSDKWIRRMAEQRGMIEPFEPGQCKHAADGHRIVSYGTSSYGYDVRCAREFKIFTNINSTIVDPKNFDPSSFVDVTADVCLLNQAAGRIAVGDVEDGRQRLLVPVCVPVVIELDIRLCVQRDEEVEREISGRRAREAEDRAPVVQLALQRH